MEKKTCCENFGKSPYVFVMEMNGETVEICWACLRHFINEGWCVKEIKEKK